MDERAHVLEMLATGKITPEQGMQLLAALPRQNQENQVSNGDRPQADAAPRHDGRKPQWFHVRVTDVQSGRVKVNVTIPIGLVKLGIQIGARFAPEVSGLDADEIVRSLHDAVSGPLVDVNDDEDGERVEIFVD